MAIRVNYYPPMGPLAEVAQAAGQAEGNLQQQQLGLQLEGIAQRERMQNRDLAFRGDMAQFSAQVDRANLNRRIAANQQSQVFDAMARERMAQFQAAQARQAQAAQQIGRERLELFNAANQRQMLDQRLQANEIEQEQRFQRQQELMQLESSLDISNFRDKLDEQGRRKLVEYERVKEASERFLADMGLDWDSPQGRQIETELFRLKNGMNLPAHFLEPPPTFDEWKKGNLGVSNGHVFQRTPDGGWVDVGMASKEEETLKFEVMTPEGPADVSPGQSFVSPDGYNYYISPKTLEPTMWPHDQERLRMEAQQPSRSDWLRAAKDIFSAKQSEVMAPSEYGRLWEQSKQEAAQMLGLPELAASMPQQQTPPSQQTYRLDNQGVQRVEVNTDEEAAMLPEGTVFWHNGRQGFFEK